MWPANLSLCTHCHCVSQCVRSVPTLPERIEARTGQARQQHKGKPLALTPVTRLLQITALPAISLPPAAHEFSGCGWLGRSRSALPAGSESRVPSGVCRLGRGRRQ